MVLLFTYMMMTIVRLNILAHVLAEMLCCLMRDADCKSFNIFTTEICNTSPRVGLRLNTHLNPIEAMGTSTSPVLSIPLREFTNVQDDSHSSCTTCCDCADYLDIGVCMRWLCHRSRLRIFCQMTTDIILSLHNISMDSFGPPKWS